MIWFSFQLGIKHFDVEDTCDLFAPGIQMSIPEGNMYPLGSVCLLGCTSSAFLVEKNCFVTSMSVLSSEGKQ